MQSVVAYAPPNKDCTRIMCSDRLEPKMATSAENGLHRSLGAGPNKEMVLFRFVLPSEIRDQIAGPLFSLFPFGTGIFPSSVG